MGQLADKRTDATELEPLVFLGTALYLVAEGGEAALAWEQGENESQVQKLL